MCTQVTQQVLSGKMSFSSFSVHQRFDSQQQLLHQYKNSRKREIVIKTNSNLSNSSNLKSNWQPNKQLLRGSKEVVGHFYGS